ncbi:phage tail tape measure protein [Olsenella phocaeensis]|uniref:phage tail tape measure protein n=1 Tax=Olsenella phocaeensis TaxID=1852385 RepID=UPI003A8D8BB2
MADGANVANAYVQIIPSMQGAQQNISDALSGAVETAADAAGSKGGEGIGSAITSALSGLGSQFAAVGGDVGTSLFDGISAVASGAGGAAVVASVAALGTAVGAVLLGVGGQFDELNDSIQISTGASGDELQALADTATSVFTSVPTSMETAGGAVAAFSQRMGLSGDTLQEVASKAASLQNVVGDVDLGNLTGMFNEFGVSGEQAGVEMDYLFGVTQQTGIGFNELVGIVQGAGPAMQQLGFSLNDTADFAGQLDKAGINASQVMGSMKKALSSVAEEGGDVQQTFHDSVDAIQGFVAAGDDASAIAAAKDIFGARNAPQFVAALKSGAVSLDQLGQSALGASGDIEATEEATMDWPEQWQLIQNGITAALEPLGSAVWSAASSAMQGLSDAMSWLSQAAQPVTDAVGQLASGALAQMQPVLQPVVDALGNLGASILPVVSGALSAVGGALQVAGALFSALFSFVSPVVSVLAGALSVAINAVAGLFSVLGAALDAVGSTFSTVAGAIQGAWSPIAGFFSGVVSGITGAFSGVSAALQGPFDDAVSAISSIPGKIVGFFSGIGDRITSAIGSIHFPQPSVSWESLQVGPASIPIPHVSWYGAGGLFDGASLIGVGERGTELAWPSYGPYLDKYGAAIASHMDAPGETLDYDRLAAAVAREVGRLRIYLDKKELVGGIADEMDAELGRIGALA